jgi:hypothetical protein
MAEEVLQMQPDHTNVLLELSYSEKDEKLLLVCSGEGNPYNPLEQEAHEMRVTMLGALCEKVEYSYSDSKNVVTLEVRK